jgi:hypothetical protein
LAIHEECPSWKEVRRGRTAGDGKIACQIGKS